MSYKPPAPKPGYPKKFKFQTKEELDEYLDNDKLTCLICGNEFYSLTPHLNQTHNMTADQYREMYGILWTKGLSGNISKKKSSEKARKQFEKGLFKPQTRQRLMVVLH